MAADHESTTVLVLFVHTGAGHRRAAEAVIEALAATSSRYGPVMRDPLTGPSKAGRSAHGNRGMLCELEPLRGDPAEMAGLIAGLGRPETLNSGAHR